MSWFFDKGGHTLSKTRMNSFVVLFRPSCKPIEEEKIGPFGRSFTRCCEILERLLTQILSKGDKSLMQ